MKICKHFVNYHCSFDCPNFVCDKIEDTYDIPCEDAGYERVKCKECYLNKNNTCEDCYLQGSKYCKGSDHK